MATVLVALYVEAGTFPKPVVLGGKRLWHRGRLSEFLDRLDPARKAEDDPIMRECRRRMRPSEGG